ncbi:class I SAM-dependent methyltransferase [Allomesorhizobium camelthorni]|uniref:Class I SAM-dependent methyltransferase n=1 Tax=Allomesorhizobium camelthorni TaxID=475069 RepID=A0A6G4WGS9_9HYPH|nr:class I SAM-dependent methyltransferase [Mesorhizobium camelthorni]NGO53403.1 class I SAM-dependent methyltransferase [Mesorhizobium camelthorni]
MSFYHDHVLPHLINMSMRNGDLLPYRQRVMSDAEGRVLEIGIGSGLNLPFYPARVSEIIGLDPSVQLAAMARQAAERSSLPVSLVEGSAEAIPLDDASVDTVVTTWTLCSVPAAGIALQEVRRVLKPGGQLLFVEHGLSPDAGVRGWQNRLTPIWKRIGGGCHLNRAIRPLIENAGFRLDRIETGYARGPRPMAFMYEGRALP